MTKDQMPKDCYCVLRHSCFVLISSFEIRASSLRNSPKPVTSQNDGLTARGSDTYHRQLCTGQFGDVSDIFSRSRRKLRKFTCTVCRRIPASDFFVNGFAIREFICVTWRNIQPLPE